jgi:phospholipase/carboxylesterase
VSPAADIGPLAFLERPAASSPDGLLVLHHGRGTDESDLLGLADALDPARRLQVVTPRAPLRLQGSPGYHWYLVPRVGYPDHDTFHAARGALADLHDRLWEESGIEPSRTVFGGFSMGAVMSYAMGLGAERPPVAGLLAFSGFVPVADGWEPHFEDRLETRAFIAHGRRDPIIDFDFARQARERLESGGLTVDFHQSELGHQIDPAHLLSAAEWLETGIPPKPA